MGGSPYLVGERGPELFVPGRTGMIVPNNQLSSGTNVTVGTINITVQNTGENLNPAAQKQIAGQVRGIVLATLANEKRSGGMLR
jgi:phage-related minor tail protein